MTKDSPKLESISDHINRSHLGIRVEFGRQPTTTDPNTYRRSATRAGKENLTNKETIVTNKKSWMVDDSTRYHTTDVDSSVDAM